MNHALNLKYQKSCQMYIVAENCPNGYTGPYCETTCPYPYFGYGCQLTCTCSKARCDVFTGCIFHENGRFLNSHVFTGIFIKNVLKDFFPLINL